MQSIPLVFSRRIRTTPFEARIMEHHPRGATVYNHMVLTSSFVSLEEDYQHLCEHVQLWDVSCERQVEVTGPDAEQLVEYVTPRDLSKVVVGQGVYAPLVDENGGIINDPIILKLSPNRFWVSIADSDVYLWMKGLAAGMKLDVEVFEPDVSPLAVQGPKAEDLLAQLIGEHIREIKFFGFIETTLAGAPIVLARSGWSGQGGFELYLQNSAFGLSLWDHIFEAGEKYNIRAGCPNQIERMETGLLSYGSDMTLENNPLECGLDKFCHLDKAAPYLSREALLKVRQEGVSQKLVHLIADTEERLPLRSTWPVFDKCDNQVGFVTSQANSQKYNGLLMMAYIQSSALANGDQFVLKMENRQFNASVRNTQWG